MDLSVMEFPRQKYLSGLPFPSPGDLPDPDTESPSPALAGGFFTTESESGSVISASLQPHGLDSRWNYPGQKTGVDSLSLLQGIFQPRDQTQVSLIAGGFFVSWATREDQEYWSLQPIPSPGDLPNPGTEPGSPALHSRFFINWVIREALLPLNLQGNLWLNHINLFLFIIKYMLRFNFIVLHKWKDCHINFIYWNLSFPGDSDGKESACSAGDLSSIPGSVRSPVEINDNLLLYSCLKNSWTEVPGELQSVGSQRVRHDWDTNTTYVYMSVYNI